MLSPRGHHLSRCQARYQLAKPQPMGNQPTYQHGLRPQLIPSAFLM